MKLLSHELSEANKKIFDLEMNNKVLGKAHEILKRDLENVEHATREIEKATKETKTAPNSFNRKG